MSRLGKADYGPLLLRAHYRRGCAHLGIRRYPLGFPRALEPPAGGAFQRGALTRAVSIPACPLAHIASTCTRTPSPPQFRIAIPSPGPSGAIGGSQRATNLRAGSSSEICAYMNFMWEPSLDVRLPWFSCEYTHRIRWCIRRLQYGFHGILESAMSKCNQHLAIVGSVHIHQPVSTAAQKIHLALWTNK